SQQLHRHHLKYIPADSPAAYGHRYYQRVQFDVCRLRLAREHKRHLSDTECHRGWVLHLPPYLPWLHSNEEIWRHAIPWYDYRCCTCSSKPCWIGRKRTDYDTFQRHSFRITSTGIIFRHTDHPYELHRIRSADHPVHLLCIED